MASVTGMTAEKITQLTDEAVVNATIDADTNSLTLVTKGGTTINAGALVSAEQILELAYPVGSIYMSVNAGNPADIFGFGTWVAHAQGRVLVGVDPSQTEFDTVGKTGGAKTVALTTQELPSHSHSIPQHNHTMNHDHPASSTSSAGTHSHNVRMGSEDGASNSVLRRNTTNVIATEASAIESSGAHSHTVNIPAYSGNTGTGGPTSTGTSGAGAAHNNLQPYITCYMWRRTA